LPFDTAASHLIDYTTIKREATKKTSNKKSSEYRESRLLEPIFSSVHADVGVFCPALKANIHCGGTFRFKKCIGGNIIGRVLDSLAHDKVLTSVCPLVDYTLFQRSPFTIENIHVNEEVYQSRATDEVAPSRITAKVYVFTQEYIEENSLDLCGITNVYTIHHQQDSNNGNTLDEIPKGKFKSFPFSYAEHYNIFCLH
jgi:hypothetical protein